MGVQMLYSQIVLRKGIPFDLHLPSGKPVAVGSMSREQLDAELMKGVESLKSGKSYTVDEMLKVSSTLNPLKSKGEQH